MTSPAPSAPPSTLPVVASEVEALLLDAAPLERGEALSLFSSLSARRRLTLPEAARLAKTEDPAVWEAAAKAARAVREEVFGRRVVLFAPLYLSNHCGNNCLYCGFRAGNRDEVRVSLTPEQAVEEARFLYGKGFRRLLLVTGEHPGRTQVDYLTSVLRAVYRDGTMRILHVNAAPMAVDELKEIKKAGAGVFQVFQETYHPGTYAVMHPSGRKADYAWRLTCMDRAMEAGFGDVGVGPLLGLYDWRFEALAVVRHSEHLFERFGAFPHTLSVPRFKPAFGSPLTEAPSPVSDGDFEKVVVLYRLAVPSAGVVVSTREPAPLRERCLEIGASQISAGSKVDPGGYATGERKADREQFPVGDTRSLDEVVRMVLDRGHVPSLCTACYRSGRTGDTFTEMAMDGHVRDFCLPNALLTLAEYAVEREPGDLKERCLEAVRKESAALAGSPVEAEFGRRLARTLAGEKDLHF